MFKKERTVEQHIWWHCQECGNPSDLTLPSYKHSPTGSSALFRDATHVPMDDPIPEHMQASYLDCCDKNTATKASYRKVDLGLWFQRDQSPWPSWHGSVAVGGHGGWATAKRAGGSHLQLQPPNREHTSRNHKSHPSHVQKQQQHPGTKRSRAQDCGDISFTPPQ